MRVSIAWNRFDKIINFSYKPLSLPIKCNLSKDFDFFLSLLNFFRDLQFFIKKVCSKFLLGFQKPKCILFFFITCTFSSLLLCCTWFLHMRRMNFYWLLLQTIIQWYFSLDTQYFDVFSFLWLRWDDWWDSSRLFLCLFTYNDSILCLLLIVSTLFLFLHSSFSKKFLIFINGWQLYIISI